MDRIAQGFGYPVCHAAEVIVGAMSRCYDPAELRSIGWISIGLCLIVGLGWRAARRV